MALKSLLEKDNLFWLFVFFLYFAKKLGSFIFQYFINHAEGNQISSKNNYMPQSKDDNNHMPQSKGHSATVQAFEEKVLV